MQSVGLLQVRSGVAEGSADVLTPAALETIAALAPFDEERRGLMRARIARRLRRQRDREPIAFLPADATIGRTGLRGQRCTRRPLRGQRDPADLKRQWIQGTGPAAKPSVLARIQYPQCCLRSARRRRLDV